MVRGFCYGGAMKKPAIRTAVIPAAGLGTRSLPATKVIPKEMLPVLDVPAIQVVVEEAVRSGIERIVLVLSRGKHMVADHFDRHIELEAALKEKGKIDLLEKVLATSDLAEVVSVRQPEPLGLGHAVLCARSAVGAEPFSVLLPDDLVAFEKPALKQLMEAHAEGGDGVVALAEVPEGQQHLYGIAAVVEKGVGPGGVCTVSGLVEKPPPGKAPSRLAVVGRYVLPPEIFAALERVKRGALGEIQLTDAIQSLVEGPTVVKGKVVEGQRFDLGDPVGYIAATIDAALARPETADRVRKVLSELLKS